MNTENTGGKIQKLSSLARNIGAPNKNKDVTIVPDNSICYQETTVYPIRTKDAMLDPSYRDS